MPRVLIRWLRDLPGNRAATRPDHPDPSLRTHRWDAPFEQVWHAARTLATEGMDGWSVTRADSRAGVIRAEARTPVLGFVDDVEIRLRREGDRVAVDVESRSRVGVSDLGANPRRVRRFLTRLQRRLGPA